MEIDQASSYMGLGDLSRSAPERRFGDVIQDLSSMETATDLKDLFAGLARSLLQAVHADAVLISALESGDGLLRDVAASVIPPATLNTVVEEYRLDEHPVRRYVIEEGTPVEISLSDDDIHESERGFMTQAGFARGLVSPLLFEGRAMGIASLYRIDDRPFRSDDPSQVALLTSFASSAHARIQLAAKLEKHYTETIEVLVSALDARDPMTQAHTGRIRDMAVALAIAMKVPPEDRRAVKLGALLHDVGKIGISDAILLKPGPLTQEEWQEMRKHPAIGEEMLKGIDFLVPALPTIRHHHERWDGNGYPDGLAAENIPLGARLIAVCDAFDAMTNDRPYRKAMPFDAACREILACAETQFDPLCAELLVEILTQLGEENLEDKLVRYAL